MIGSGVAWDGSGVSDQRVGGFSAHPTVLARRLAAISQEARVSSLPGKRRPLRTAA